MRILARGLVVAALLALALPAGAAGQSGDAFDDPRFLFIGEPDTIGGYSVDAYSDDDGEVTAIDCGGEDRGVRASAWWRFRAVPRRLTVLVAGPFGKAWVLHPSATVDDISWCQTNAGDATADLVAEIPETFGHDQLLYLRAGACYVISTDELCTDAAEGPLSVLVVADPPANDARANATPVTAGAQQGFDNHGATEAGGETLSCALPSGAAPYHSTVWFRYTAPAFGTATFTASEDASDGFDNVLAVYRSGENAPLQCFDNPATGAGSSTVTLPVQGGRTYDIQVGSYGSEPSLPEQGRFLVDVQFVSTDRDGDGDPDAADCAPDDANRFHGARDVAHNNVDEDCSGADDKDADDDGRAASFAGGDDCDDGRADVRPGLLDRPHNGVDEDCAGGDDKDADDDKHAASFAGGDDCDDNDPARFPGATDVPSDGKDQDCSGRDSAGVLGVDIRVRWGFLGIRTLITRMRLESLEQRETVVVRCRGRGCPFSRRTFRRLRPGARDLTRLFGRRRALSPGVRLEISVTAPGWVGRAATVTIRRGADPRVRRRCLAPGTNRTVACRVATR